MPWTAPQLILSSKLTLGWSKLTCKTSQHICPESWKSTACVVVSLEKEECSGRRFAFSFLMEICLCFWLFNPMLFNFNFIIRYWDSLAKVILYFRISVKMLKCPIWDIFNGLEYFLMLKWHWSSKYKNYWFLLNSVCLCGLLKSELLNLFSEFELALTCNAKANQFSIPQNFELLASRLSKKLPPNTACCCCPWLPSGVEETSLWAGHRLVFSKEEHTSWLSSTKYSALKTHMQETLHQLRSLCLDAMYLGENGVYILRKWAAAIGFLDHKGLTATKIEQKVEEPWQSCFP